MVGWLCEQTSSLSVCGVGQSSLCTQMSLTRLFTTPIFYVNGTPHIGHAYSVVLADFYARASRLRTARPTLSQLPSTVRFASGTDEHGFKVARAASALNIAPRALCDQVSRSFRDTFARLDVVPDDFVRTTESRHALVVAAMWRRLERRGLISLSIYSGWYCVSDEAFVPDDAVVTGPDPADPTRSCTVSRESGNVVERIDEPTYMFDMARLRDSVRQWLLSTPSPVRPLERLNEVLAMLDSPAASLPLSVSRPRARVGWGIEVPRNPEHTIYVWLDALCNYLTVLSHDTAAIVAALDDDSNDLSSLGWPPTLQVLGKDILRFHAVYWPSFLLAAGIRPPAELLVHAFWTTASGDKVSKSRGNAPRTLNELLGEYEADALRYFLLRHGGLANDSEFSETLLAQCRTAELVDRLGNLLSRLTGASMLPLQRWPASVQSNDGAVVDAAARTAFADVMAAVDARRSGIALESISTLLRTVNTFVAERQPWTLARDGMERASVLRAALHGLRVGLVLLQPAMPTTCARALDHLNVQHCQWSEAAVLDTPVAADTPFAAAAAPILFPRTKK